MNIETFTELRKKRNVPMQECAACCGLTRQHFLKCIKNDTLRVVHIKKLSVLLRCNPMFFIND